MATSLGTAYVQVRGDLSSLNKQLVANFHPSRLGKLGKTAGVAIGAGLAAGVGGAAAGKALFDLGSQFDKQFDKIRVGTGKTGAELKGLQGDFKNVLKTVPADFASVGTAVTGLNARLGLTGKPLQKLTRQIVELSRITQTDVGENVESLTRLFGDWSVSTGKQAGHLDELFRTSQKTGIGVSDLARLMVQFGSPLRALGFDFETAAAMFGRFEKEGVNIQTSLPGLRFALKTFAAAGKDPKKALADVFEEIKRLGPGAKSTSLAFKTFGQRAGPDMVRAILEGRFELDQLVRQMKDGGDTIEKAGMETRDFGQQWQLLKNRVFVGLEPIASKFFETVGDGMERLATADFGKIGADLGIDTSGLDLGGVEEDLSASAARIRSILDSGLVKFIGSNIVGGVKRSMAGLLQAFRGGFQGIAGVLKLIDDLVHLRLGKIPSDLKDIFGGGMKAAVGVFRLQSAPLRELASRAGAGLSSAFRTAWDKIKSVFSGGVRGVLSVLRGMVGTAGDIGSRVGNALLAPFKAKVRLFRGVAEDIVGILKRIPGRLGNIGSGIFAAMKRGLSGRQLIPSFKINLPSPVPDVSFPGVKLPSFAKGGKQKRTQLALVGEEGPELAELPVGTRVHSHPESKRIAKDLGIPGFAKGGVVGSRGVPDTRGVRSAASTAGLVPAVQYLVKLMREKFGLSLSSGVRGRDTGSYHAVGKAGDFIGSRMREAGDWVKTSGLYKTLLEGIHNPNLSTDSGKMVPSGFWGAKTWADHKDHIHLAASSIAASVKRGLDEKGGTRKTKRITGKLSLGQMVTLAKQAGFPDPALAAAVGYAESRGQVGATGDGGDSHGLWQINIPAHPKYDADKLESDARYNAKAALSISQHGKNWKPWTQFRNGAYKPYLGASADPLPKGGAGAGSSSKADYLAFWLEQAEATQGKTDDLRQINKSLRYWRGILRRNRAGNPSRASEALGHVNELRTKKKELRDTVEESAYELTPLGKQIGSGGAVFSIQNLQGVLDSIEHDSALAALTETLDKDGNVTPASFTDDLASASKLRDLWGYLFGLTTGAQSLPGQGSWKNAPGEKPLDRLGRPTTAEKAKWWMHADGTVSGAPRTIAVAGKPVPIIGTQKQQTYAAQQLKDARDALKSIQDEMKTEDVSVTGDAGPSAAEQIKSFLAALGDLTKQFGSNFRPLKGFAKGGTLKHSLALVGEQGFEMAKKGPHLGAVGLGGPEIRELPVGTRVFPHEESKRMAKQMGIQPFAQGGVIRPRDPASQAPDPELAKALQRIEALLERQEPKPSKVVLHEYNGPVKQVQNEDPHTYSRNSLFEIGAAIR